MRLGLSGLIMAAWVAALIAGPAAAGELPAGEPLEKHGMQITGVYLQPVQMEPVMADQDPKRTDIHLEADIKATADNKNGFGEDDWVPFLRVSYTLTKKGSAWRASGDLHSMVANDGPHYGANVKLDGSGEYALVFRISPPDGHAFMRHTDKETGVAAWWPAFEYTGGFKFVGTGKKGGY